MRISAPHRFSELMIVRICLDNPPTVLDRLFHQPDDLSLLRHPIVQTQLKQFRNFNRIPIAYAFRPQLRGRLTLSGLAFLRKPWAFGEQVSRLFYRYSFRHNHFHLVHCISRYSFDLKWNAPLPDDFPEGKSNP